jgi:hypothetical protein
MDNIRETDSAEHGPRTIKVSMVSLKWGDVLSTLLPGSLALFSIAPFFPSLNKVMLNLEKVSPIEGFALLIASTLAGGVLEAFTRITWEKLLVWLHPPCDALSNLNSTNLDLYERGVQSSYKYVTFYANFAWAMIVLLVGRVSTGRAHLRSVSSGILLLVISILLVTSYVQWTYYVNYQKKIFGRSALTHVE